MTKEQVRAAMFSARTLEECEAAWAARAAYLAQCPDEWEDFLDAGATLTMKESALKNLSCVEAPQFTVAA